MEKIEKQRRETQRAWNVEVRLCKTGGEMNCWGVQGREEIERRGEGAECK